MSDLPRDKRLPFDVRRHYLAWAISPKCYCLPPDRRGLLARLAEDLPRLGDATLPAGPFGDLAFVGDATAALWYAYQTQGWVEEWTESPDITLDGWSPDGQRWRELRAGCFAAAGFRGRTDRAVRAVLDPFEQAVGKLWAVETLTPEEMLARPRQPRPDGRGDLVIELCHQNSDREDAMTLVTESRVRVVEFGLTVCPGPPAGGGTGHDDEQKRPGVADPLLTTWQQIINVINRGRNDDLRLRNDRAGRREVVKLHARAPSPITFPTQGGQPQVREADLLAWLASR